MGTPWSPAFTSGGTAYAYADVWLVSEMTLFCVLTCRRLRVRARLSHRLRKQPENTGSHLLPNFPLWGVDVEPLVKAVLKKKLNEETHE